MRQHLLRSLVFDKKKLTTLSYKININISFVACPTDHQTKLVIYDMHTPMGKFTHKIRHLQSEICNYRVASQSKLLCSDKMLTMWMKNAPIQL